MIVVVVVVVVIVIWPLGCPGVTADATGAAAVATRCPCSSLSALLLLPCSINVGPRSPDSVIVAIAEDDDCLRHRYTSLREPSCSDACFQQLMLLNSLISV